MTRAVVCLAVLATFALGLATPHTASAQSASNSPDRRYCDALVDLYRAYVSDPNRRNVRPINAQDEVAIAKCQSGDPSGIPTLEQALTNQKISLPRR